MDRSRFVKEIHLEDLQLFEFTRENIKKNCKGSGVYFLFSAKREIIYIGESVDLRRRLYQHNNGRVVQTKDRIKDVMSYSFIVYENIPTIGRTQFEKELIKKFKPPCNIAYVDL